MSAPSVRVFRDDEHCWDKQQAFLVEAPFFTGRVTFDYNACYGYVHARAEDATAMWYSASGQPLPWSFPADWFRQVQVAVGQVVPLVDFNVLSRLAHETLGASAPGA